MSSRHACLYSLLHQKLFYGRQRATVARRHPADGQSFLHTSSSDHAMNRPSLAPAIIAGLSFIAGLALLGFLLANALVSFKAMERTVTVKGLSEREVAADIVIWPITFTAADNDLAGLYGTIDRAKEQIAAFLITRGVGEEELSSSLPAITDKSAQQYDSGQARDFRYTAVQTVTVYSARVDQIRGIMNQLSALGKSGIVFKGDDYQGQTEYLFNGLNQLKPEMIQEATAKAREVAEKFAEDSNSRLGKIRQASQGQFSIESRDKNNPHLKRVRVVSTVEYYLVD